MTVLAYKCKSGHPTGDERLLDASTVRNAAKHVHFTTKGSILSTSGKSVYDGEFVWYFQIINK